LEPLKVAVPEPDLVRLTEPARTTETEPDWTV